MTPRRLSFRPAPFLKTATVTSENDLPIGLIIPALGLELPILPARLNGNKWEASDKGVSYLVSSPRPGEVGNSILYGHNWPNLLGSMNLVRPGDAIEIVFADGVRKSFVTNYTSLVNPSETQILAPTRDRRLTLYTCAGFLDSKRFVVTASAQ